MATTVQYCKVPKSSSFSHSIFALLLTSGYAVTYACSWRTGGFESVRPEKTLAAIPLLKRGFRFALYTGRTVGSFWYWRCCAPANRGNRRHRRNRRNERNSKNSLARARRVRRVRGVRGEVDIRSKWETLYEHSNTYKFSSVMSTFLLSEALHHPLGFYLYGE